MNSQFPAEQCSNVVIQKCGHAKFQYLSNEMMLTILNILNEMITKVSGNFPRERGKGKGKGKREE